MNTEKNRLCITCIYFVLFFQKAVVGGPEHISGFSAEAISDNLSGDAHDGGLQNKCSSSRELQLKSRHRLSQ